MHQGSLNDVLRKLQKCLKKECSVGFKGVSIMFLQNFVSHFCCCMDLIAATQTEGGLGSFDGPFQHLERVSQQTADLREASESKNFTKSGKSPIRGGGVSTKNQNTKIGLFD